MDPIRFKGTRDGLLMTVEWGVPFSQVMTALENRLRGARKFFEGARVTVVGLSEENNKQAADLLMKYGVDVTEPIREAAPNIVQLGTTVTVHGVMRGGQEAKSDGTLIVMGDVNPGAELCARGDIVVMGALRGKAHAGYPDNESAYVAAAVMKPIQLRIAGYIARSDDSEVPEYPEIASVRGEQIVISPVRR